jgi:hypothetical protein
MMYKISNHSKALLFLTFVTPYIAVLLNYLVMISLGDRLYPNYLRNREYLPSYFIDSNYMLAIQFLPRLIISIISVMLGEFITQYFSVSNQQIKLTFVGIGLGLALLLIYFNCKLANSHQYWQIELLVFYPILGWLTGKIIVNESK